MGLRPMRRAWPGLCRASECWGSLEAGGAGASPAAEFLGVTWARELLHPPAHRQASAGPPEDAGGIGDGPAFLPPSGTCSYVCAPRGL